ncbi:MAG TPA: DUF2065 domain-containing protein [Gammaproteobacteria bacterium]|nr:DUF2065 domain-containing protein [Gammaproteobacteria bacterium]
MFDYVVTAIALVLVLEGLLPALSPRGYRQTMLQMSKMDDQVLRTIGLLSMSAGALLLYFFRG